MSHIRRAVHVDIHDDVPVIQRHFPERPVAKNACIVYQYVDSTEGVHCVFDNTARAVAV